MSVCITKGLSFSPVILTAQFKQYLNLEPFNWFFDASSKPDSRNALYRGALLLEDLFKICEYRLITIPAHLFDSHISEI